MAFLSACAALWNTVSACEWNPWCLLKHCGWLPMHLRFWNCKFDEVRLPDKGLWFAFIAHYHGFSIIPIHLWVFLPVKLLAAFCKTVWDYLCECLVWIFSNIFFPHVLRGVFQSLVHKHFPSEKQRGEKGAASKRKRKSFSHPWLFSDCSLKNVIFKWIVYQDPRPKQNLIYRSLASSHIQLIHLYTAVPKAL